MEIIILIFIVLILFRKTTTKVSASWIKLEELNKNINVGSNKQLIKEERAFYYYVDTLREKGLLI